MKEEKTVDINLQKGLTLEEKKYDEFVRKRIGNLKINIFNEWLAGLIRS